MQERDLDVFTLAECANGELEATFQHELERILENVQDPNTDWKAKRTITIELALVPSSSARQEVGVGFTVKGKTAPFLGGGATLYVRREGGKFVARTVNINQQTMDFEDEGPVKGPRLSKTSTGTEG